MTADHGAIALLIRLIVAVRLDTANSDWVEGTEDIDAPMRFDGGKNDIDAPVAKGYTVVYPI